MVNGTMGRRFISALAGAAILALGMAIGYLVKAPWQARADEAPTPHVDLTYNLLRQPSGYPDVPVRKVTVRDIRIPGARIPLAERTPSQ